MLEEKQKLIVQTFEKVKKAAGTTLAVMLLWDELPNEFKKSFGLGNLFELYEKTPKNNPIKLSIRQEIFGQTGKFNEWKNISEKSKDDPALNSWAKEQMVVTANRFSDYQDLYLLGYDVIDKMILATTNQRERLSAYEAARNDEDKARLKQFLFTGMRGVTGYAKYIYWSKDISVLNKIKDAVLPHEEWIRLYDEYGGNYSPEELFVFLFHKRCQDVYDFDEGMDIIDCERYSIRTTDLDARISKDMLKVRMTTIKAACSPEQIRELFQKRITWRREEIPEIIKAFRRMPKKLGFAGLIKLREETYTYSRELKGFLVEEMYDLDLRFADLIELWRIEESVPLLYRIFNAAETIEEYATIYGLYYGFISHGLENDIKQRAFVQMQKILASQ
ncbi:MAG: hypothetical protein WC470_03350 [Candidatus Paceibacterota bacterium]